MTLELSDVVGVKLLVVVALPLELLEYRVTVTSTTLVTVLLASLLAGAVRMGRLVIETVALLTSLIGQAARLSWRCLVG